MDEIKLEPNQSEDEAAEFVQERGVAKAIIGNHIEFGPGLVGTVTAQQSVEISRAAAGVVQGNTVEMENGGAGALVAGGNMEVTNGGAQVIVAGGGLQLTNGGAQMVVAGGNVTAHKSILGVVISSNTTLTEGSKVILNTPQAIAFGAAAGVLFGLFNLLSKKHK